MIKPNIKHFEMFKMSYINYRQISDYYYYVYNNTDILNNILPTDQIQTKTKAYTLLVFINIYPYVHTVCISFTLLNIHSQHTHVIEIKFKIRYIDRNKSLFLIIPRWKSGGIVNE